MGLSTPGSIEIQLWECRVTAEEARENRMKVTVSFPGSWETSTQYLLPTSQERLLAWGWMGRGWSQGQVQQESVGERGKEGMEAKRGGGQEYSERLTGRDI